MLKNLKYKKNEGFQKSLSKDSNIIRKMYDCCTSLLEKEWNYT